MAKRDYYEILGVSKSASHDEIRKAHRKLVRQYHPDVNKTDKTAEAKFKEVQEAYDVLGDEQKRQRYDQFGHAGVGAGDPPPGAAPGADPFEAFRRAQAGAGRGRGGGPFGGNPNVRVEGFGDAGGFSDLFEQMFGGGPNARGRGGRGRPGAPPRGDDVEHGLTITFEQSARGTTIPLQINRDGQLETIDVKIPAGVKDGSRVRVKGKGGHTGGEPGDLYIITTVTPHPYFRREGNDIHVEVPISMYEAILGTKVEVPTLDGPVTVTIPPGTGSHAKLRIRGRGIERAGQKGDQLVVTKVVVPKTLDEGDRKVIEEWSRKHPLNPRADWPPR